MPEKTRLGQPFQARWLALVLTLATVGLAACGDDGGGTDAATTSTVNGDGSAGAEGGEKIVIRTHVNIEIPKGGPVPGSSTGQGEVLDGSSIGDSPFCPGGTFSDMHSDDPDIGLVDRTFRCPDGRLRIGFTPGVPQGRAQAGPWKVVSGTGSLAGLHGDGQMEIKYEPGTGSTEGREKFTGTVVP
ncbi:MAG: hypothetical protein QOI10_12 [Solirubrobacterales bacterium]|jgi:hypothetical protein|nr:hypothetical protein [Solirubrobacterales bacterium]